MAHTSGVRRPAVPSRRMLLLLCVTCAVAVGNIYFPQSVGPLVATGLQVSPDAASLVVTATQIGYTAGIVLLVPLGDRIPHRRLLVVLLVLTGLALLAAGCAPALPPLVAAAGAVGLTTVAAQVVGPLAAGLTAPDHRGRVVGTLLSGSTAGMLLARTFSAGLGERFGWRAPYLVAAVVAVLLAAVLALAVPQPPRPADPDRPTDPDRPADPVHPADPPQPPLRYPALLAEPLRLLRREPELRRSCLYQASVFAGFSAVWTALALLLTGPAYGLGPQAVGTMALVGAATVVCTPLAGRLVDHRGADLVNLLAMLTVLLAAALLAAGTLGGLPGLATLTAGTLLLDVGMQCGMVANQARVYALRADARSRLNTAYMMCAYLGGSAGSWLGVQSWRAAGWPGVCTLLVLLTGLALARHLAALRARPSHTERLRSAPGTDPNRPCSPAAVCRSGSVG
ncbi:MFS transporter [Kitasatospora sp. NPDC054939]